MKEYKKKILKIFIPIMLSNLISQVQMLIDRIFLGRIDVLYMSAVGNASTPIWATLSAVFSLSVGASILISQAIGEGNKEKVEEYAASLVKFNNIIPIILFLFWTFCCRFVFTLMGVGEKVMDYCVDYAVYYAPTFLVMGFGASFIVLLQTSNYTKHLATYSIIRSASNIVLDYCLIFGNWGFPELGIKGAALATTISEYIGMLFGAIVFVESRKITTRPRFSSVMKAKIGPFLHSSRLGINTAFEDFTWQLGNLGIIRILNSINETAAGIYTIVFSFEVLIVVIVGALGNSTMTVCGEATGANNIKLFRNTVRTAYIWSAMLAAVTVVCSLIFPKQILGVFTQDSGVINNSAIYLLLISINLFGKSGNMIVGNGIRGYGDTKWMFFTQIFGTIFVVSVACLFVFGLHFGMIGVYFAVIADEIVRALINTGRFSKIKFDSAE